jgi:hypothetical protein
MRTPFQPPANPGNAGTAVLLDTGAVESGTAAYPHRGQTTPDMRGQAVIYVTVQPVTFRHVWYAPGSANGRVVNGGGAGEAVVAGTALVFDRLLLPGRNVFEVLNGATAPTLFEVAAQITDQY